MSSIRVEPTRHVFSMNCPTTKTSRATDDQRRYGVPNRTLHVEDSGAHRSRPLPELPFSDKDATCPSSSPRPAVIRVYYIEPASLRIAGCARIIITQRAGVPPKIFPLVSHASRRSFPRNIRTAISPPLTSARKRIRSGGTVHASSSTRIRIRHRLRRADAGGFKFFPPLF